MKTLFLICLFQLGIFSGCAQQQAGSNSTEFTSTKIGFALVELYTSQGCSSCPPADRLANSLEEEAQAENQNIFFLNFHVDYWNYLGWKDPYSKAEFSARQRSYSRVFANSTIYTPQAIVNGSDEVLGSNATLLRKTIQKQLTQQTNTEIKLNFDSLNQVSYQIENLPKESCILHYALVQLELYDEVSRGENAGKNLYHKSAVKALYEENSFQENGKLPLFLKANERVIAWIELKKSKKVLAANQLTLTSIQ